MTTTTKAPKVCMTAQKVRYDGRDHHITTRCGVERNTRFNKITMIAADVTCAACERAMAHG